MGAGCPVTRWRNVSRHGSVAEPQHEDEQISRSNGLALGILLFGFSIS